MNAINIKFPEKEKLLRRRTGRGGPEEVARVQIRTTARIPEGGKKDYRKRGK